MITRTTSVLAPGAAAAMVTPRLLLPPRPHAPMGRLHAGALRLVTQRTWSVVALLLALVFSAASAQGVQYATLTIDLSTIGEEANAVIFDDGEDAFSGATFLAVGDMIRPVPAATTSFSLANLLDSIGSLGWQLRGTMQAGPSYILIFQMTAP